MTTPSFSFYEFFAGGGMARLGLGDQWECALQMIGPRRKTLRTGRTLVARNFGRAVPRRDYKLSSWHADAGLGLLSLPRFVVGRERRWIGR